MSLSSLEAWKLECLCMRMNLNGECVKMKVSSRELCMKVMNLFKLRTMYKGDESVSVLSLSLHEEFVHLKTM